MKYFHTWFPNQNNFYVWTKLLVQETQKIFHHMRLRRCAGFVCLSRNWTRKTCHCTAFFHVEEGLIFVNSWRTGFSTSKIHPWSATPRKRNMTGWKILSFSMGNTSSNGGCSIVMLVLQKLLENWVEKFGPIDSWVFCLGSWQDVSIAFQFDWWKNVLSLILQYELPSWKRLCCTSHYWRENND